MPALTPAPRTARAAWLTAGLSLGIAWLHPTLWPLAWLAPAATLVALWTTRTLHGIFIGGWVACLLTHVVGFSWVPTMNRISVGYSGATAVAFDVAEFAAWTVCPALALLAFAALLRRGPGDWRLPIALWLPAAWLIGEHGRFLFLDISIDDWLTTQWTVQPVLRAVGHLGWWAAGAGCLLGAACLGQAVITRDRRWLLPPAAIALGGLLLPALPVRGLEHLEGIAAVHVGGGVTLPHRAPPGEAIDLVVWPEDVHHLRPFLGEGPARGARIAPPLPDSDAQHLMGLVTRDPLGGRRNQFVVVAADGAIVESRAKRMLMPAAERPWLGLVGHGGTTPGRATPHLTLGARPSIPLICGELLSRGLLAEGRAAGGEVLIVGARDQMMVTDQVMRQLLAVQVLRSVEFGVPSVRASLGGWAYFVASDGAVLARSGRERNGFLMWDRTHGARDVDFFGRPIDAPDAPAPPLDEPTTAVLYSTQDRRFRARCPEGRCTYHALEDFTCPDGAGAASAADTVIVSGHGRPPTYLSHPPEALAAAVRCFAPELVVIDTCYGASATLFAALGELEATVVAAASKVPVSGLHYEPAFFTAADPDARAAAIRLPHGALTRWRIDQPALSAELRSAESLPDAALQAALVRRDPPAIRIELPGAGPLLAPVDPARVAR